MTTPQRLMVEGATVLRFPPHVKFRFDETRQRLGRAGAGAAVVA